MSQLSEWTVMFYLATDNDLSPIIVSQIKAIKDAGFQADTNVLIHLDPNEKGAPTRIFNVNLQRKQELIADNKRPTRIGDGRDPFVRDLIDDDITRKINPAAGPSSKIIGQTLKNPDKVSATDALTNFVNFCVESHPAKHYILILVGHGMIVG